MGCGSSSQTASAGKPTKMAAKSYKAPTGLVSDITFKLSNEDLQKSCGLAIDIGSTMGKLVYRSNKEYKDGKPINPEAEGQAHFALFPRGDVQGMIKYVKENCDLTANEQGTIVINSSGVGGAAFKKDLEAGLNCKLEIVPEFDCFCKAFISLEKSLTPEELIIPPDAALEAEAAEMRKMLEGLEEKSKDMTDVQATVFKPDDIKDEDRSRFLVMAGSGTGIMELKADGTFGMVDGLFTAGRFMYGLASFLTGENDYSKLVQMAEKGDGRTTDTWSSDLLPPQTGEGDNIYELGEDMEMSMFSFGKGITSRLEEVKKEDLCYSVFNATATIHAQTIAANIRLFKVKEVFFVGNCFNSKIMQTLITKKKNEFAAFLPTPVEYEYKFLKNGGMYGALGAYLTPPKAEEKAEEKTEEKAEEKTEESPSS